MLVACWSVKGGSGTSVVAAALALVLGARSADDVVLVDLDGDQAALLGLGLAGGARAPAGWASAGGSALSGGSAGTAGTVAPAASVGVRDWLAAGEGVGADALRRLEVDVRPGVRLLPWGGPAPAAERSGCGLPAEAAAARLVTALSDGMPPGVLGGRPVVVDCGLVPSNAVGAAVAAGAGLSLLVLRPCFLALRRAVDAPARPSGVVLVEEPAARALTAVDVEDALGVPVQAVVRWAPEVARAADAGLLAGRLPRVLSAALRGLPV